MTTQQNLYALAHLIYYANGTDASHLKTDRLISHLIHLGGTTQPLRSVAITTTKPIRFMPAFPKHGEGIEPMLTMNYARRFYTEHGTMTTGDEFIESLND